MSVQIRGNSGTIAEVELTQRAVRTVQKAEEYATGHFAVSAVSGTMAAALAANAEIAQFRFTHATNLCVVRRVRIWAGSVVGFTAGFFRFELIAARGWTADGSGGAASTLTGNNNKLRTAMTTVSGAALRCATTAALGAGTKTLDAQGLASVGGSVTATAGDRLISPSVDIFDADDGPMHPLVLANQEGFAIRATVPATGTWTFGVDVSFHEVDPASY